MAIFMALEDTEHSLDLWPAHFISPFVLPNLHVGCLLSNM